MSVVVAGAVVCWGEAVLSGGLKVVTQLVSKIKRGKAVAKERNFMPIR